MTDTDYGEFTPITVGSGTTPKAEVVAWKVSATDRLDQFFETEGEAVLWANSPNVFGSVVTPLVTLASLQAAEALVKELERDLDEWKGDLIALGDHLNEQLRETRARVKELESENARLRDLVALTAKGG